MTFVHIALDRVTSDRSPHARSKRAGPPTALVLLGLALAISGCGGTAPGVLDDEHADVLRALEEDPESAGALVFEGVVTPVGETEEVFRYQRRVLPDDASSVATHMTFGVDGKLALIHRGTFADGYRLKRLEEVNAQEGFRSILDVEDDESGRLTHTDANGTEEIAFSEGAPFVAGPTLFGFIITHLDEMLDGERVDFRFVVLPNRQVYDFAIRVNEAESDDESVAIDMFPTSPLVAAALKPMLMKFHRETHHIVSYRGRVPVKRNIDGRFYDFDADIAYPFVDAVMR